MFFFQTIIIPVEGGNWRHFCEISPKVSSGGRVNKIVVKFYPPPFSSRNWNTNGISIADCVAPWPRVDCSRLHTLGIEKNCFPWTIQCQNFWDRNSIQNLLLKWSYLSFSKNVCSPNNKKSSRIQIPINSKNF